MTDVAIPTSSAHSLPPSSFPKPARLSTMTTRSSDGLSKQPPQEALTPPADDSPRGRLGRKRACSINTEEANNPRVEELSLHSPASFLSSPNNGDICICPAPPRVPRPRNAFILYRQAHQAQVVLDNPGLPNPQISKKIGEFWSEESEDVKNFWKRQAEEEKERHKIQHPYYKYQPRRNQKGLAGRTASTSGEEERCPNCHKRRRYSVATPRTPSTPFAPMPPYTTPNSRVIETAHLHHYLHQRPSVDMFMYGEDRDRNCHGGGGGQPQYANSNNHHPDVLHPINEDYGTQYGAKRRRDEYDMMSPAGDSKRVRRYIDIEIPPDHRREDVSTPMLGPSQQQQQFYAQSSVMTYPNQHPQQQQYQQHHTARRLSSTATTAPGTGSSMASSMASGGNSLPRPPPITSRGGPGNGPMAPPPRPSRQFSHTPIPAGFDQSLTLPPLQIPASPNQTSDVNGARSNSGGGNVAPQPNLRDSQERGVEAMVMSIPYMNKLNVLHKISPPLQPPRSASPAVETRGPIIAIEGSSAALMKGIENAVERALNASGEFALKTWTDRSIAAAKRAAVGGGRGEVVNATAGAGADDVDMMDDVSVKDDKSSNGRSHSVASAVVGGDSKAFGAYLQTILEWHLKSQEMVKYVTTKASAEDDADADGDANEGYDGVSVGGGASRRGSAPFKLPVALIPGGFSLTLSDKFASSVAITDPYSPVDHWQWMATLWRGIVGPDLVIYVHASSEEELLKLGVVEYKTPSVMIVRVDQAKSLDVKTERRLTFEVMEWVRAESYKEGYQFGGE